MLLALISTQIKATDQIQLNSFKDFLLSLIDDDETTKKKNVYEIDQIRTFFEVNEIFILKD